MLHDDTNEGGDRRAIAVTLEQATLLIHQGERLLGGDDRLGPITGHTLDELMARPLLSTLFAPVSLPSLEQVIAERDLGVHFFFVLGKTGGMIPVEVATRPGVHGGESVQFTLLRAVESERQVSFSLSEWERRFRHTLDNVRMIAVQLDRSGTIIYSNDFLLELTGWRRDELIGQSWFDRFVLERDRDMVRQVHARIMAGELEMAAHFDNPILTKAGDELMVSWNNTVLLDENGVIVGSSSLGEDITRRLAIAADLSDSEARWRSLSEGSPDHVITVSPDLIITYVNRPSPGLSYRELMGAPLLSFLPPDRQEKVKAILEGALASGENVRYETGYDTPDGRALFYETHAAPLWDDGNVVGLTLVARDVTERKESERRLVEAHRRLEEAVREKDQYLSLIAHDIKSPLSGIRSVLRMIEQNPDQLARRGEEVGRAMVANIDKVLALIDHMLTGRGAQGITAANRKMVSLRTMVDEAIAALAIGAENKGVALANTITHETLRFVDPMLTHQLLTNLLANAIKFSHAGGEVSVDLSPEGEGLMVVDRGVGIEADRIATLLDPSQATTTIGTANEGGYGLGLPFCQKIAQLHGGDLAIESTPGRGTTVTVRLPDQRPSILIVDDDELIRIVYGTKLRDMGMRVEEAANGVEAIRLMEREKPDMVLCDIHMAPGDGFTTLRWVREEWEQGGPPFYLISSDSRPDTRQRADTLGANGLLVKPLSDDALTRTITTHLFA